MAIIDDFEAKLINSSFMFSMVVYYISLPVFKNFFTAGLALGEARVGWIRVLSSHKFADSAAYELEIEGPRRRPCEARRAPERASTFAPTPRAKPRSRVSA